VSPQSPFGSHLRSGRNSRPSSWRRWPGATLMLNLRATVFIDNPPLGSSAIITSPPAATPADRSST
jgi:hypothetical protein